MQCQRLIDPPKLGMRAAQTGQGLDQFTPRRQAAQGGAACRDLIKHVGAAPLKVGQLEPIHAQAVGA